MRPPAVPLQGPQRLIPTPYAGPELLPFATMDGGRRASKDRRAVAERSARHVRSLLWVVVLGAVHACTAFGVSSVSDGRDAQATTDANGSVASADGGPADSGLEVSADGMDADAAADAGDADVPFAARCSPRTFLGSFAVHNGKVNVHTTADGGWEVDSDCTSGNNIRDLSYCQKFWPTANTIVSLLAPDPALKPFSPAGCPEPYNHPGEEQFVCCGDGS
jgi:hypothetical protein